MIFITVWVCCVCELLWCVWIVCFCFWCDFFWCIGWFCWLLLLFCVFVRDTVCVMVCGCVVWFSIAVFWFFGCFWCFLCNKNVCCDGAVIGGMGWFGCCFIDVILIPWCVFVSVVCAMCCVGVQMIWWFVCLCLMESLPLLLVWSADVNNICGSAECARFCLMWMGSHHANCASVLWKQPFLGLVMLIVCCFYFDENSFVLSHICELLVWKYCMDADLLYFQKKCSYHSDQNWSILKWQSLLINFQYKVWHTIYLFEARENGTSPITVHDVC